MADTGSAQRLGIAVPDPQLEARLRRVEVALASSADSNTGGVHKVRGRLIPPRVTGLRLDTGVVGGIAVRWNAVDTPTLKRYEVDISQSIGFTNRTTARTRDTFHLFPGLVKNTTYYVRVRAINKQDLPGLFSPVLNTKTGQATFLDLAGGAASNIVTTIQTSGFFPATVSSRAGPGTPPKPTIGEYAKTRLSFPKAGEVIIFSQTKASYVQWSNDTITIDVLVDGIVKSSYEVRGEKLGTPNDTFISQGLLTVPGLAFPQLLGTGQHDFSIRVSLTGSAGGSLTSEITPQEFTLVIWTSRN